MTDAPTGVAPVGTSVEALDVDVKVTELRKLYFIVFSLTLGIRIACYIAAIAAFFALPTRWSSLAVIALLLVGGRIAAQGHTWAWRGYKAHSINADDPAMRERVVYEDSQARAQKAAKSALVREAQSRTLVADRATKAALEQIEQASEAARVRADEAVSLAKKKAEAAAAEAKRLAELARAAAEGLASDARQQADAPAPEAKKTASPASNVVSIADAEGHTPTDGADKAPVRPAV